MSHPVQHSYNAKTSFDGKEGYAVYTTTDTPVKGCPVVAICGANAIAKGLIKEEGNGAGTVCSVVLSGKSFGIAGASINAGAELTTDTLGRLVTATSGQNVIAVAEKGASVGEKFEVEVIKKIKA